MKINVGICVLAVVAVISLGLMAGCDGDGDPSPVPTASVQVMLVDAPADQIDQLHLEFESVEIARRSAPVTRLMGPDDLPDDVDVLSGGDDPILLGTVNIPEGSYTWANLAVMAGSPVNRVVANGTVQPLQYEPPRGQSSNLDSPIQVVGGTEMALLFDFEAAASVSEQSGEWVLNPQIYSSYIERDAELSSLRGTITEPDGEMLTGPGDQVVGLFLTEDPTRRTRGVAEVNPQTGAYDFGTVVPGRYLIEAYVVGPNWSKDGGMLRPGVKVSVTAGEDGVVNFDLNL